MIQTGAYTSIGEQIKQVLHERKMTQKYFAEVIGVRPTHLSEMLRGMRNIPDETGRKIEEHLGIPSEYIMQEQLKYKFKKKIETAEGLYDDRATLKLEEYDKVYDVKMLLKKCLDKKNLLPEEKLSFCEKELRLKVSDRQEARIDGYFRKSEKTGQDARMIVTWTVIARYKARTEVPKPRGQYNKELTDQMAKELAEIFHDNYNTVERVTRKMSEYGVKFCIVKKLPKASIDGYSFIDNGQPVIVITKRYDRIDNMAFAVLHEVGHLKLHLKNNDERVSIPIRDADDIDKRDITTREEVEANEYASNILIPQEKWKSACEQKVIFNPFDIQKVFTKWAKRNNLNKWIVLGRISHETGMYMFKSDKTRSIN